MKDTHLKQLQYFVYLLSSENPAYLHIRANRRQAYETAKKLGNDPALFSVAQSVFYDHSNQLPSLMAEARRDLSRRCEGFRVAPVIFCLYFWINEYVTETY